MRLSSEKIEGKQVTHLHRRTFLQLRDISPNEAGAIRAELSTDETEELSSFTAHGSGASCFSSTFCACMACISSVSCWCCWSNFSTSFTSNDSTLVSGSIQQHIQQHLVKYRFMSEAYNTAFSNIQTDFVTIFCHPFFHVSTQILSDRSPLIWPMMLQ